MSHKIVKLLKLSTILSVLFTGHALANVSKTTVQYKAGSLLGKMNCTGSFIEDKGKTYFISAAHCFKKQPRKAKLKTYPINEKNFKKIRKKKIEVRLNNNLYFNYAGDIYFNQVPSSKRIHTNKLKLANHTPRVGEIMFAVGYPVAGKPIPVKLNCTFVGTTTYEVDLLPLGIGRVLKCYTNLKTIRGISGGPIVDTEGNIHGIISAEIQSNGKVPFKGKRFAYVIYNEVTTELLEERKQEREVYDFVKMDHETFEFVSTPEDDFLAAIHD